MKQVIDGRRLAEAVDPLAALREREVQDAAVSQHPREAVKRADRVLAVLEEVVGHDEVPATVVTMNSSVHCREQGSGKDYHLTLVYPKDANADEGKISILAPVGSALLGLQVGQHIDWPAPGGKTLKLELLGVEGQPKDGGAFPL